MGLGEDKITGQTAKLSWRDDVIPVSVLFDDPYFSLDDGLAETRHVFVEGNRLSQRFGQGLHIAELGFGTGLSFLVTWAAWEAAGKPAPLRFTSFEAFPMARDAQARALAAFPSLASYVTRYLDDEMEGVQLTVIQGDARQTLPRWDGRADAWFLDGFAPAKNPELWGPELLGEVARHTAQGGTFATYTAAGHVRRSLTDAGFDVERVAGFGRKRHMTIGALR